MNIKAGPLWDRVLHEYNILGLRTGTEPMMEVRVRVVQVVARSAETIYAKNATPTWNLSISST